MLRTSLIALFVVVVAVGCDENQARQGCRSDADCRGQRMCADDGQCVDPGDDVGPDDADIEPDDLGTDVVEDLADDPPKPDGIGVDVTPPPDVPDPDICQRAIDHVVECGYPHPDTVGYGVDWERCDPFSACGAECALDMSCGGLDCDFNPDIDCDSAPLWDCLQARCGEPEVECRDAGQCNQAYDCCVGAWVCFPEGQGVTCDLDCEPPTPAPGCDCEGGRCRAAAEDRSICQQADARFTACGYNLDDIREDFPEETAHIEHFREGLCDPLDACVAACVVHERDDQCMQCHFGLQLCTRDPFAECWQACQQDPPAGLCVQSGGLWGDSECENCCGPDQCGSNPFDACPEPCCGPPQCYCPNDAPFWHPQRGCFASEACFPEDGAACVSQEGVCADGPCPPDRVDSDSALGCAGRCCVPAR